MATMFLAMLLTIYPPKPDLAVKFTDISISRTLSLAKTFGIDIDLSKYGIKPIEGRIGFIRIELRGNLVFVTIKNVTIKGDPIESVVALYHRKTSWWSVKAIALGGVIELEGIVP